MGFVSVGEIQQYQAAAATLVPTLSLRDCLRPPRRDDVDQLVALDAAAAGMPRGRAVRHLLLEERVVVLDQAGTIAGFSVLRPFGQGYAIGPLVAPDLERARALISYWRNAHDLDAGKWLRIDVNSRGALPEWLEAIGLKAVGSASIMLRGVMPVREPSHGRW